MLLLPCVVHLCRYQLDTSEKDSKPQAVRGFSARMRLWSAKRTHQQQDDRIEQIVQPPVHGGGMLKLHNIATLLFWLACCVILLDSHVPSWPLNKLLTKALTKPGQAGPSMPVWGLMSLVYVGLWVLHWLAGALADSLPSSFSSLMGLARKDSRRAAEHYYPYGKCSICRPGLGACGPQLLFAEMAIHHAGNRLCMKTTVCDISIFIAAIFTHLKRLHG
jgi:hypothetical protein